MRRLFRFGLKARRAWIVQQIERGVVPGNLAEARLDGDLAVVLLRLVVHGRRAGRDGPHLRNRPARAEERLDQRRLSGSPVRKDSNIADRLRFGFLHKRSLQGKRGGILAGDAWSVNRAAPAHAVRTPASLRKIGPPAYAGDPASGSVVVSLDPSDRVAGVVTDGKPHRHGRRRPDLSALALGLELEAVAAPGQDLHFQPRASRDPFELERAVPVAPERSG